MKTIIGIMGPGKNALPIDLENAYQLGKLIAKQGWVLLTGGRKAGVMEAANQGAKAADGLTIGILPGNDYQGVSEAVDIAIITDMGNGRNNINVLSSQVVVACGMGAGTASEIALALKANKPVILLPNQPESYQFFQSLSQDNLYLVEDVESAIAKIKAITDW
ncbi:MAG: TIGR00725 family protein [Spirulinaceae cyanobacterium]